MVDSINLSTNAYVRCPRPIPPPPRSEGFDKDSYLNNIIDIKNPLLNTLTLKNQLDQKEQSYYEILINKLEFNNNEYVSNVLSDRTRDDIVEFNEVQNVCSSVEKIITNSPSMQNSTANAIEPPIVPPPPLLSSFVSDNVDFNNLQTDNSILSALPLPLPEPPKRTHTHYLEPIFESLEYEKNF